MIYPYLYEFYKRGCKDMQQWQFKISGIFIVGDASKTQIELKPENFTNIIRLSDYVNKNMPNMLARVNVDKSNLDIIIKNAKTSTLHLKIEKFNACNGTNATTETYIEDDFSVFVSNDINYFKELDYDASKAVNGEANKDIYKEIYLGLMSKKTIDANKCVANGTFMETPMMDIVTHYTKDLHILIEPFTYNKIRSQLIVPPIDTLVSLIKYLNNVEVFYATPYLFFMDEPRCSYLISRSGQGVPRKDETYSTVSIDIKAVTDKDMALEGMDVHDNEKCYYLPISVADTKYSINNDLAKIIDRIDGIINPSKDNSILSYDDILATKAYIDNIIEKFKAFIKSLVKKMGNVPERLKRLDDKFKNHVLNKVFQLKNYEDKLCKQLASQVTGIPKSVDVKIGKSTVHVNIHTDAISEAVTNGLTEHLNIFGGMYERLNDMSKVFEQNVEDITPIFYDATYLDNWLNAVTEVNVQDVIEATQEAMNRLNGTPYNNVLGNNKILNGVTNIADKITGSFSNIVSNVESFNDQLNSAQSAYGKYFDATLVTSMNDIHYNKKQMDLVSKLVNDNLKEIVSTINNFKSEVSIITNAIGMLQGFLPGFRDIMNLDLKSKFVSLVVNARTIKTATVNGFERLAKSASSDQNLGYGDIKLLDQTLDNVKDLSAVGKLGLSTVSSDIAVGNNLGSTKIGTHIFVSDNDNPNEIKNMKSDLESKINILDINKYDIDPSVFTPNKKYIVKNYEAHSDKDGTFLLNKKTEVFIRQDDTFRCVTSLNFNKVPESTSTNPKTVKDANERTNNTNKEDWYAKSKGEDVKNGDNASSTDKVSGTGRIESSSSNTYHNSNNNSTFSLGKYSMSDSIANMSLEQMKSMGLILT